MPTTVIEKLGALHTGNYADFAIPVGDQRVPNNFEELVLLNLEYLENAPYLSQPHIAKGIHGGMTPTIGYGFDLKTFGTWAEVRRMLVYGLGGEASLTSLQRYGLDILRDYRNGNWTDADIMDMVENPNRASPPRTWTDAQANAVQSITFTAVQAEAVLKAMVFGDAAAGIFPARSFLGMVRNIVMNNYDINEPFPESSELAAIIIMRFRGDFSGFNSVFNDSRYETAGARRAEFWWRILDKIDNGMAKGVKTRLGLCAKMFGVFPADASTDNPRSVLEALSLLCRLHLGAGLSSGENLIRNSFQTALTEGVALLGDSCAPEDDGFDVVQLARQAGKPLNVSSCAENHPMHDLVAGSNDQNAPAGGNYTDCL
jgi:hypothetical protein